MTISDRRRYSSAFLRTSLRAFLGLAFSSLMLTGCSRSTLESTSTALTNGDDTLTVWWEQGYYAQEDEAIAAAIKKWQAETGNKVELSFIDQDTILKETQNALSAGNPPALMYSHRTEETLSSLWAKEGKLADVSDVVEPLESLYSPAALKSASLYNAQADGTSIYAVPLNQKTTHLHYSKTLLKKAGLKETDIPTEWSAFWDFWKQAQDNLRAQGDTETYGLGLPMSSEGHDTYNTFEQVLEAYDVQLLDESGTLQASRADVKQGVIEALSWYTDLYAEGYVPPAATDWRNRDNNIAFLNEELLLVANPTLSIPGSQREDDATYKGKIATVEFPNEPDGDPPQYRVSVQQVVVFEASPNKELAKDFLSYLMQPENIGPYVEGTLGRFFPAMPALTEKPFWNDASDPHVFVATKQFQSGKTSPQGHQLNPAYGLVQSENVWGLAIEKVVVDKVTPEAAATEALSRIEAIFSEWEQS